MNAKRLTTLLIGLLVGTLTLGGCGFSVYDLPLPGGASTGSDAMTVKVQFADVLDLVPQSTVKLDDVTVGKVTSIKLDHGVALVTMKVRRGTHLPANVRAEIQQTSLLGEKYVDLVTPTNPSVKPLTATANGCGGDTAAACIPLSRTGRNPEIEEVLGALSLILNGGGVAQLKTISTELNKALGGREDAARSVLDQVDKLMANLDDNKQAIVNALQSIDRLSKSVRGQEKTIDATLDELPSAISSIDKQRQDLVKMLQALGQLGKTGVRVIKASKDDTVAVVRDLQPVLTNLANTGDHFVNAFNTFLTYPFVDAAVGVTPQEARNTQYGDYINLDITLNLNLQTLQNLPDVGSTACTALKDLAGLTPKQLKALDPDTLCKGVLNTLDQCQEALEKQLGGSNPLGGGIPAACQGVPQSVVKTLTDLVTNLLGTSGSNGGSDNGGSNGGSGGLGGTLGGVVCGLLACRAPAGYESGSAGTRTQTSLRQLDTVLDPNLVTLMVPGLDASGQTTSPRGAGQ